MGIYSQQPFDIQFNPPPAENMRYVLSYSPRQLFLSGLNIPVEISTASIFRNPPLSMPLSSVVVLAHFDTGASYTSIDTNLAKHLNLKAMGQSKSRTALIGRDIMSRWNIVWNGPTSTVFISD